MPAACSMFYVATLRNSSISRSESFPSPGHVSDRLQLAINHLTEIFKCVESYSELPATKSKSDILAAILVLYFVLSSRGKCVVARFPSGQILFLEKRINFRYCSQRNFIQTRTKWQQEVAPIYQLRWLIWLLE